MTPGQKFINAEVIRLQIIERGPNRVVVGEEGVAVPPRRALQEYGIKPDVVFVRSDGWSLGAPARFEEDARAMWNNYWIAVLRAPDWAVEPVAKT